MPHGGVDITVPGGSDGKPILAMGGGTVVENDFHDGWGNTIVIDHGNVYMSEHTLGACRRLGTSVQPAIPDKPTDKPVLERFFRTPPAADFGAIARAGIAYVPEAVSYTHLTLPTKRIV